MQDPEAYLRARTARLDRAREGSPYPVARLSLEAVANAFTVLGLLPAARAEKILAARRPVLKAAGFRVGAEIGELRVSPGTRAFQEARTAALDRPRQIPLAVAAGPVRCRLRRHDLAITWATLTPDGIRPLILPALSLLTVIEAAAARIRAHPRRGERTGSQYRSWAVLAAAARERRMAVTMSAPSSPTARTSCESLRRGLRRWRRRRGC